MIVTRKILVHNQISNRKIASIPSSQSRTGLVSQYSQQKVARNQSHWFRNHQQRRRKSLKLPVYRKFLYQRRRLNLSQNQSTHHLRRPHLMRVGHQAVAQKEAHHPHFPLHQTMMRTLKRRSEDKSSRRRENFWLLRKDCSEKRIRR